VLLNLIYSATSVFGKPWRSPFKIKGKCLGLAIRTMAVQRWTDEMLDNLASSTTELREGSTELRESVTELRESVTELRNGFSDVREGMADMRESIGEIRDSVDGLRITSQALLQVAAQNQVRMDRFDEEMTLVKQRQSESDQRFNILLEEVRFLIRGKTDD
jgi:methyl-accepting chemotaxis protein